MSGLCLTNADGMCRNFRNQLYIDSKLILNPGISNSIYAANPNPRTRRVHGNSILQTQYDHSRHIQIVWERYVRGMFQLCLTDADKMRRQVVKRF